MNDDVLTVEPADLRSLFGLPSEDEIARDAEPTIDAIPHRVRPKPPIDWTLQQLQFFQNRLP